MFTFITLTFERMPLLIAQFCHACKYLVQNNFKSTRGVVGKLQRHGSLELGAGHKNLKILLLVLSCFHENQEGSVA